MKYLTLENKKVIRDVVLISVIVLFAEYLLLSVVGTIFRIVLSIRGLKYTKEKNIFGIYMVLGALLLPVLISIGVYVHSYLVN